jgi:hypothetical protein
MDDPDFKWETGCDLADEALLHDGFDLAGLKEQVMAAVEAPPVAMEPSSIGGGTAGGAVASVKGLAGLGVTIVAALGVGYWLGTAQPEVETAAPVAAVAAQAESEPVLIEPPPAPVAETLATEVVLPLGGSGEVEAPSVPVVVTTPTAARGSWVAPAGTADVSHEDGGSPAVVASAPSGEDASEPAAGVGPETAPGEASHSDLAAEMNLYDDAVQALTSGDHAGASARYRSYLERYPSGQLVREAELSLLECLFQEGSFAEAEAQAARLLATPGFGDRRHELSLVRAESLILLNRCDEAVTIVDMLGGRDARGVAVRRECKRRR